MPRHDLGVDTGAASTTPTGKCPTNSISKRGTPVYSSSEELIATVGFTEDQLVWYEDTDGYVCYTSEELGNRLFQQPCNSGDYAEEDGRMGCGRADLDISEEKQALVDKTTETAAAGVAAYDAIYSALGTLDENGFLELLTFERSSDLETASTYIQDGDVGVFYEWLELEDGTQQARYYAVTNNFGPTVSIDSKTSYNEISITLDSAETLKLQERFGNIEGGSAETILSTKLDEMAQEIIATSVEQRDSFKKIRVKPFSQKNLATLGGSTESGTTITGITSTSTTMGGSY